MTLLQIDDLSFSYAGRALLDHATLAIGIGQKIGLIGKNGAGKSTLLRLIDGGLTPDGGTIQLGQRVRLGSVAQEAPSGAASALEHVLGADMERTQLLAEAEHAAPERLADIHDRLIAIQADSAPSRASAILNGLGFDSEAQIRPMSTFSGGWRMRVGLASALFAAPDLLLLDEPTNHLDLEAAVWLETWLTRFPGAVLMVSHDRNLLDRAVDSIAHLNQGKIVVTPGGFANYVRIRTERAEQQKRNAARVAAQRAHIQKFVDRFRATATKARQAQSRLKAIARLPAIENLVEDSPTRFCFPVPEYLPPPLLSLDDVSLGYNSKTVLGGISLRVDMGDRIALLGANGNGKSTLAKALSSRLPPQSGSIFVTGGLRIGYFAQHQEDDLDLNSSAFNHLARALPHATATKIRAHGANFGLSADRIEIDTRQLSGGEKARLLLALATCDAPHILILDEPTNHLDIDAREAIIRALTDFSGAIILITHDPYLIDVLVDRLLLVADGKVTFYDDDLTTYQKFALQNVEPKQKIPEKSRGHKVRRTSETIPLRRHLKNAEQKVAELDAERAAIEQRLSGPDFYTRAHPDEMARLYKRLAAILVETENAMECWMAAENALAES